MVISSRTLHSFKAVVPAVFIICALYLFGARAPDYHEVLRQFTGEKKLWTTDLLENEVGGPLDSSAITALCESKQWNQGLVFSCDPPQGGPGHVRNAHLNCIRLAIEAGAELIIPDIVKRSADISQLNVVADPKGPLRGTSMDYLYDKAYLKQTLSAACPQMKLYDSLSALSDVPTMLTPIQFQPGNLPSATKYSTVVSAPEDWHNQFFAWLDNKSPLDKRKYPIRVHFPSMNFYWPVASDGPGFARNFGKILRPRDDARRLAAAALFEMNQRFGWRWNPRHDTHMRETFIGVHLRTEKDAGPPKFRPYAEQAANYLSLAFETTQSVIFLATGKTATNVDEFILSAKGFGKTTVTKHDLLQPEDVVFMNKMTFDQQALIDFEILLRSGLHTGPAESSFSWNVALRRGIEAGWPEEGQEGANTGKERRSTTKEVGQQNPEGNIRWKDEWGILYGPDNDDAKRMAIAIWP